MTSRTMTAIAGLVLSVVVFNISAAPRLQTGPDAEVTPDGLRRVDKTVLDAAWVAPDLDLRGYTKLMVVGAAFSYKAVDNEGKRYIPGRSNDTEFYISQKDRERVEQEMKDAFVKELTKLKRYELVNEAGPGVLLLIGGVYDIVSSVPPANSCTGRCDIYLRDVGAATLILELRDSLSHEILVRAADRRAAETAGWPVSANSVTVWSDVRRLATYWAARVRNGLEKFDSIDDLAPKR